MMKHEFEELAGYEVATEDYNNIIEPMYMATNLSKHEFVKVIDKKRFALKTREQLVKEMKMCAKHLRVLDDINTMVTTTDTQGDVFKDNQTIIQVYMKLF